MNKNDISTIKRRLTLKKRYSISMYSCFLRANGEEVGRNEISDAGSEEFELYMSLFKKVLSGQPAQTLLNADISNAQVLEKSPEYELLEKSAESLDNRAVRDALFDKIREAVMVEHNIATKTEDELAKDPDYLILLLHDVFDVKSKSSDDSNNEDENRSFSYILACVCPVKMGKPVLTPVNKKGGFGIREGVPYVDSPEVGFMYPAYESGYGNIGRGLIHTKKKECTHDAYQRLIFGKEEELLSASEQTEAINTILATTLDNDCTMELIAGLNDRLAEVVNEADEEVCCDIPDVGCEDFREVMEEFDVPEEKIKRFENEFTEKFGERARIAAVNAGRIDQFSIKLPDISIIASPESADKISTQIIQGVKYITIVADSDMEINGIPVGAKV